MFQELFCSLGFSFFCEEFVSFQAKCEFNISPEHSILLKMKESFQLWDSLLRKTWVQLAAFWTQELAGKEIPV